MAQNQGVSPPEEVSLTENRTWEPGDLGVILENGLEPDGRRRQLSVREPDRVGQVR